MSLQFVTPAPPGDRTRNIVLYGHGGTGKSTGAIKAPSPILYLNAEGEDALETPRRLVPGAEVREVVVTGEQTLHDVAAFLQAGGDGIKTVVLDSLSETYRVVLADHQKSGQPTLPEYGHVASVLEQWLRIVRELPFHVVVICHVLSVEDQGVVVQRPHVGSGKENALGRYIEHVFANVLGYCAVHEDKYVAQLVPANGRTAKDRTDALGKTQPLDVGAWIKTINQYNAKKAKETSK